METDKQNVIQKNMAGGFKYCRAPTKVEMSPGVLIDLEKIGIISPAI